jgi:hypothetical protein
MSNSNPNLFHIGLCMAGSVSAGAYTAGVIDYLTEALENWEAQKGDPTLPQHGVVIDLLSGTSGGGINAAMTTFAMRDKIEHARLWEQNGKKEYNKTLNNIFWQMWVDMKDTQATPLFEGMLDTADIDAQGYVSSALNPKFIDSLSDVFSDYITKLAEGPYHQPNYLCPENELCLMVFNVTGIRYKLVTSGENKVQYAISHRDIGHFRWQKFYDERLGVRDGRIEIHFENLSRKPLLIEAAKCTSAFPGGLKTRLFNRPAKYIWDNPFFRMNRFDRNSIFLGEGVCHREDIYTSTNADGGTANNEPIEMSLKMMYEIRQRYYKELNNVEAGQSVTYLEEVLKNMDNASVILIDPLPSISGRVDKPETKKKSKNTDNLTTYAPLLVGAMRTALLTDTKLTMDAYSKEHYGLHLVAPSRDGVPQGYALACSSLGAFGGFLHKEFRIHDFFLGRRNCQSFIRRYFVANLNETDPEKQKQIQAVINGYKANSASIQRFQFEGEDGKMWVPIIPDVTLKDPYDVHNPQNRLLAYDPVLLSETALDHLERPIKRRVKTVIDNVIEGQGFIKFVAKLFKGGNISSSILTAIKDDLKIRGLMRGKPKNTPQQNNPQIECPEVTNP